MAELAKNETPITVISNGVLAVSLLRETVVRKAVGGIGKSTLWRWIRDGHFPKPVRLGANCVAWRSVDVEEWINTRPSFDAGEA